MWLLFVIVIVALIVALAIVVPRFRRVVHDYEWGLRFRDGRLRATLEAGAYWLNPWRAEIRTIDRRRSTLVVGGQEIASRDNIGIKISVVVLFEVADAETALLGSQDFRAELYARVQLALRDEVVGRAFDELIEARGELNEALTGRLAPAAETLGLQLHEVAVRDFMLAADVKRSFHEVLKARKEGEAALERTRGETAALRNLNNATRLLRDNPELVTLRILQALERSQGNTFHLPPLSPAPQNEAAE